MALAFATVRGRFLVAGMSGTTPIPLQGSVTFTPEPAALYSVSDWVTFLPAPLSVPLDTEGFLSLEGSQDIKLLATDGEGVVPAGWTWRVSFEDLHHDGMPVKYEPFSFSLPAGSTMDLATVERIPPSTGTGTGTKGMGIGSVKIVDGALVFTMNDGATFNAGTIPADKVTQDRIDSAVAAATTSAVGRSVTPASERPGSGLKTVPVPLTVGLGFPSSGPTNATYRIPVRWNFPVVRWRMRVRNIDLMSDVPTTGAANVTGVWVGKHGVYGSYPSSPTKALDAFTVPADGSEYVSPWTTTPVPVGASGEALFSFGYTATTGPTFNFGTAYMSNDSNDASSIGLPVTTLSSVTPFSIVIDVETSATVPVVASMGDGTSVGVGSSRGLIESWLNEFCQSRGAVPVHGGHAGESIATASNLSTYRWERWQGGAKPDALIFALGSEDAEEGFGSASVRQRFDSLMPRLTKAFTNVSLAQLLPRTNEDASDPRQVARFEHNDYLASLPFNVKALWKTLPAVSSDGVHVNGAYDVGGAYMNTAGYVAYSKALGEVVGPSAPWPVIALRNEILTANPNALSLTSKFEGRLERSGGYVKCFPSLVKAGEIPSALTMDFRTMDASKQKFFDFPVVQATGADGQAGVCTTTIHQRTQVGFFTNGTRVQIHCGLGFYATDSVSVYVDGEKAHGSVFSVPSKEDSDWTGNPVDVIELTFPDSRYRQVWVTLRGGIVQAVKTNATAELYPGGKRGGLRVGVLADSWGAGTLQAPESIGQLLYGDMNVRTVMSAIGSTGLVRRGDNYATSPATSCEFTDDSRLKAVADKGLDVLLVFGSINDQGVDTGALKAAAQKCIDATLAVNPSAKVVFTGRQRPSTYQIEADAAIAEVCAANGDRAVFAPYCSYFGDDSNVGPTDEWHPSPVGARRIANWLLRLVKNVGGFPLY